MKIIFAGTPDFAKDHLEIVLGSEHEIICVLTQPDRRASIPLKGPPSPGTPMTGRTVFEATAPARCAANPAMAIKTFVPPASHSLM